MSYKKLFMLNYLFDRFDLFVFVSLFVVFIFAALIHLVMLLKKWIMFNYRDQLRNSISR